jgi:ABC-type glycerol-3-phosphate transport system permease component
MRLWLGHLRQTPLVAFLLIYTVVTGGPFLWVAAMSLRTTPEILDNPYALPIPAHWDKFVDAWTTSRYGVYFLSGMILPPQLMILSLFQILLQFGLYNTLAGLSIAYVATQLAMTVYILEGFFAQLPQDLFDAARMDGYSDFEIFWRITLPIGLPAVFTTVVLNFIILWNEFLYAIVLITEDDKRTLPLGIMHFMGSHQLDVGMIATGLMISMSPIILLYALFSETLIKGMTAGAVR